MATKITGISQAQTANVVVSKSPILSPLFEEVGAGATLQEIFSSHSGLSKDHTKIFVNGAELPNWDYTVQSGDCVSVCQQPKDPGTLAVIAIVVSVLSAVAGYMLFEAPAGPTESEKLNRIRGPRNEAKPYDPVPVAFGDRKVNPAYAAEPYTTFKGTDEYLSMLLCPAQGPVKLSDIRIGDTPITEYADIQFEYFDGFTNKDYSNILNVWDRGVVQEQVDAEVKFEEAPLVRNSAAGSSRVSIDIIWPRGLRGNNDPTSDAIAVRYQHDGVNYAVVPKVGYIDNMSVYGVQYYQGSYWVVGVGQDARSGYNPNSYRGSHNIDQYFVNEYFDPATNRTLAIFDADALLADGLRIATVRAYAYTNNEFLRSFTFSPVNPFTLVKRTDSVQISLQKAFPETGPNFRIREARWLSIKSETTYTLEDFKKTIGVSTDNENFTPAIIALRIRATNQLNGVIDNLNCRLQSVVPSDWNSDWSQVDPLNTTMVESNNPAELYRWALQGNFNKIRTPNSKIDLATLLDWRDYCTAESWETSEYVNYEETLRTILGNIAFTGRADFSYRDGRFSVSQKIKQTLPKQVFTPKNSSGLTSRREFPPNYDGIKFKFQNAGREDQVDENTYYDPYKFNNNDPTQPIAGAEVSGTFRTVELWGVTNPALAQRHARFMFFENKLRREVYELKTDIEGLVASRGDLVRIAHDIIDVGIGQGFISKDSTSSTTFFLSEDKGAVVGQTYYFQVRQVNNGLIFTEFSATYSGGGEWEADTPQTLNRGDLAVYGEQGKESLDCIIIGVSSDVDYNSKLTLVNAAPEIFDEDATTLPQYTTGLTPRKDYQAPLPPIILPSESGYAYTNQTLEVVVKADDTVSVSGGDVDGFTLEFQIDSEDIPEDAVDEEDSVVWLKAGSIPSSQNSFKIPVEFGYGRTYKVRAKAYNRNMVSAWSPVSTIVISDSPADDVIDFTVTEAVNEPKTPDGMYSTLTVEVTPPDDENYLYAIAEYKLPDQEQFLEIGRIGWKYKDEIDTTVLANGTQYEFRVRSANHLGVINKFGISKFITTTNTQSPEYTDENPFDALPVPNVRGLELFEQGNDTEFGGKDAKFVWRKSTVGDWVDLGYEGLRGAGASRLDQYFRDYQVEVWADNRPVRTEFVVDNLYVYTFEKNAEDFKRETGEVGAYREFELRVVERGRNNQVSERIASLSVSNTAPQALQGLTILPGFNVIEISYKRPVDLDFAGVDIWVSTVSGFDPDTTEPTITTSDNNVVTSGLDQNTTYYVRLRPFDDFGKTGTNTTSEFVVKTKSGVDLTGLSGWAYQTDPSDREFIKGILENDAIPSEKIESLAVGKLTAGVINATGAITTESIIRAVDDIDNPQVQVGIGPKTLGTATTYLTWAYNGQNIVFGVDELGNVEMTGALTASSFSNTELTIDEQGNVNSTGTFRFGGATSDFIEFNGTDLVIETDNFSVDAFGNATFSGELSAAGGTFTGALSAATGVFGDKSSGQFMEFDGSVLTIGDEVTIGDNTNRTVTVGTGGDFTTLNAALESLSRVVPAYKNGGFTAEISILSGTVIAEQIHIKNVDLSWITITSVDAFVTIDATALTNVVGSFPFDLPHFIAVTETGQSPVISFNIRSSDPASNRCVCIVRDVGSKAVFRNFTQEDFRQGLYAQNNGEIFLNGPANIGTGIEIYAVGLLTGAKLSCDSNLICTGAANAGIDANGGSEVVVSGTYDCVSSAVRGIHLKGASRVRIGGTATCSGSNRGVELTDASELTIGGEYRGESCSLGVLTSQNSTISIANIGYFSDCNTGIDSTSSTIKMASFTALNCTGSNTILLNSGSQMTCTSGGTANSWQDGTSGSTNGIRLVNGSVLRAGGNVFGIGNNFGVVVVEGSQLYCGGEVYGAIGGTTNTGDPNEVGVYSGSVIAANSIAGGTNITINTFGGSNGIIWG